MCAMMQKLRMKRVSIFLAGCKYSPHPCFGRL